MRKVIIRKRSDSSGVTLRCGDKLLATLGPLDDGDRDGMSAKAVTTPAFADHREHFRALAEALRQGEAGLATVRQLRQTGEALGLHVHHAAHDMRIDAAASVSLVEGQVRFRPSDAFVMMRSGGLG